MALETARPGVGPGGTIPRAPRAPAGADREPWSADPETLALLASRLRAVVGDGLRDDRASRALASSDSSNYRVLPALVATPATAEQLAAVVGRSTELGVPITPRGAGTSVAGNAMGPGLVVSTARLSRILDVDPEGERVLVEPGVVLDVLNGRLARHGLRVGPDPSSGTRCTIGGMVGNDACGPRSVRHGTTADQVLGLGIVLADGTRAWVGARPRTASTAAAPLLVEARLRGLVDAEGERIRRELPRWPRRVSGYQLDRLLPERGFDLAGALAGTEGTCAVLESVLLRAVAVPRARALLVLAFEDDVAAAAAVPALLAEDPATVEGMARDLVEGHGDAASAALLPAGGGWLFVEATGDDPAAAREHARRLARAVGRELDDRDVALHADARAQAVLWRARADGAGRATRLADGAPAWPGLEDVAVPPERLAAYLAAFRGLRAEHGLAGIAYGHFGEGCVHVRLGFDLATPAGIARFGAFMEEAAALVVAHGGTLSGEHGDGRARSALLRRQFSPELLRGFAAFRHAWDPAGLLNPGVIVDPAPLEADLRVALPPRVDTRARLALASDGGDLHAAALRCTGIGVCVATTTSALMCPSYRATGEERHSTRGRARLLQELIAGTLSDEGWRWDEVREALDLCLACRGCLSDCPTRVDMATYKAEFLDRHWEGRIRPRIHYTLGRLPAWLRLGARLPRLANLATGGPFRRLAALVAGVEPGLPLPRVAPRTFAASAAPRAVSGPAHGRVVLWPDTFTNHLEPEVGHAALRVLAAAGFEASVPSSPVCCGLTYVSTGQFAAARREVERTLGAPELAGDDPVVVLEPSCAAQLRHDLPELLPRDPRAEALARRITTLGELLTAAGWTPPASAPLRATLQPHCHQQAVLGTSADREVLERAGVEVTRSVTGCCGMAGSFGAERGHGDVARTVAELALLPALAAAGPDEAVLADGYSCRTQIAALDGRRARHLAELLAERLPDDGGAAAAGRR